MEKGAAAGSTQLPMKEIPGDYGLPVIGPVKDRLDFFWLQGIQKFFQSRVDEYQSTVFRVNMPPGPLVATDPRVICLLDQKSFPVLFDLSKVEKKDVFVGTYMPSTDFTGQFRVLSYLDPSEERHRKLKTFCFDTLKANGRNFLPEFSKAIGESFTVWDTALAKGEKANFTAECAQFAWNFLVRAIVHRDPVAPGEASLGTNGGALAVGWVGPQLAPIASSGLPHAAEEITTHSIPIPFALVKDKYDTLFKFFSTYATEALDQGQALGLDRNDVCNNLMFFICFNAFGGFGTFFPSLIQYVAEAGPELMKDLSVEVKQAVAANGGLTMKAIDSMSLVKSVVYEALRYNPPVPYQYAKAKMDFVLQSHDAAFQIKKGEMLFGYQPYATRDPKVFANPDKFLPKRFLGPEGAELLKYVYWSNGPENESPSVDNKQCPGKDLVVTMSRVLLAEIFNRYDEFAIVPITVVVPPVGARPDVIFTSLKKSASK